MLENTQFTTITNVFFFLMIYDISHSQLPKQIAINVTSNM